MAKRNRGKSLKKLPAKGRGTCPLCRKTGIKLLYAFRTEKNEAVKVCKNCRER